MSGRLNNPLPAVIATGLMCSASYYVYPYYYSGMQPYVIGWWAITGFAAFKTLLSVSKFFLTLRMHRKAKTPHGEKGSARWATWTDIKTRCLHKRKRGQGFLMGTMGGKPVWVNIESSAMILSPAGGGKTSCFTLPALLDNRNSMVVPDLKGTLAAITKRPRERKLGHKCLCINPGRLYEDRLGPPARFNPLQILIDNYADPKRQTFIWNDAQKLAKQLLPEPKEQGENAYFRSGARKLLAFAMLYLLFEDGQPTLTKMLALLSDMTELETAIYVAQASQALDQDLSILAHDLGAKLKAGDTKQLESFREGALQPLAPYSRSGPLAEATACSDFSFADLRKAPTTVYIICDPTNMDVFEPWVGMVMLNAITTLIRQAVGRHVTLMLEEVTNFKIEGLPKLLTLLREFNASMWLILQELEQFSAMYGKEALDTLLSQTETKLIHGSRSFKTCELISKMCGEKSIRTTNYSMGRDVFDRVTRSTSEQAQKLITPDDVARLTQAILFHGNMPPAKLDKVSYAEITPLKHRADPNPLFGNKPYRKPTKLRI